MTTQHDRDVIQKTKQEEGSISYYFYSWAAHASFFPSHLSMSPDYQHSGGAYSSLVADGLGPYTELTKASSLKQPVGRLLLFTFPFFSSTICDL